jgi:hypothetical protein
LSWDVKPVEIISHPLKRWCSITLIDFKDVETWRHAEYGNGASFPEFDPFSNSLVLVNHFTFFEVKSGIWLHWWGLNEWLELITWVSRGSFETKDSLNRLFTKHWESKSGSDMRELLVFSPFNIIFGTFIVIVMVSGWLISKSFLELELNSKSFSGWFSPSVIVLEEHIVKM